MNSFQASESSFTFFCTLVIFDIIIAKLLTTQILRPLDTDENNFACPLLTSLVSELHTNNFSLSLSSSTINFILCIVYDWTFCSYLPDLHITCSRLEKDAYICTMMCIRDFNAKLIFDWSFVPVLDIRVFGEFINIK